MNSGRKNTLDSRSRAIQLSNVPVTANFFRFPLRSSIIRCSNKWHVSWFAGKNMLNAKFVNHEFIISCWKLNLISSVACRVERFYPHHNQTASSSRRLIYSIYRYVIIPKCWLYQYSYHKNPAMTPDSSSVSQERIRRGFFCSWNIIKNSDENHKTILGEFAIRYLSGSYYAIIREWLLSAKRGVLWYYLLLFKRSVVFILEHLPWLFVVF